MNQNLQDYIKWNQPFKPHQAPLPTVDFRRDEPLPNLEVNHHWITAYADLGYRVCTLTFPNGFKEEFVTNEKFFSIVENVKVKYNLYRVNVYYDYEWQVM